MFLRYAALCGVALILLRGKLLVQLQHRGHAGAFFPIKDAPCLGLVVQPVAFSVQPHGFCQLESVDATPKRQGDGQVPEMHEGDRRADPAGVHIDQRPPNLRGVHVAPVQDAHPWIDWLVLRAFIKAVIVGTQTPADIYGTLTMMAIAPLSAESFARGGALVDFPDFTQGKYLRQKAPLATKYSLDLIVDNPDMPIVP